jgi:hypothetical protein
MIAKPQVIALPWGGPETVRAARRAMKTGESVKIALPLETHHALFQHLHPGAARGTPESFDIEGGPELLPRVASVAGLEELQKLEGPARRLGYGVWLSTPDPVLVLAPIDLS